MTQLLAIPMIGLMAFFSYDLWRGFSRGVTMMRFSDVRREQYPTLFWFAMAANAFFLLLAAVLAAAALLGKMDS